jgi:cytochrome P450
VGSPRIGIAGSPPRWRSCAGSALSCSTSGRRKQRTQLQISAYTYSNHHRRAEAAQGEKISDSRPRDILSLLVRANTVADPRQRLSDTEVLDRAPSSLCLHAYTDGHAEIPTFLVAGHETTATLLTWTLFQLSLHPEIQAELRAECRARPLPSTAAQGNDPLDVAELERAPLLDAVLRETLRANAPVSESGRVAVRDDMLPLSSPITDKSGAVRDAVGRGREDVEVRLSCNLPCVCAAC